ncbi:hypothetical protein [Pedobacter suwonensis]|uniref:hypothetical protein n=1 Tax=Pedobacter suwonensis TaxID=332999 RepID=UPI00368792DB
MKQEPTVSETTTFRYLKEKDIISPHYRIAHFFCSEENSLLRLKSGVIQLLKAAFTNPENADYFYLQQQLVKLLELSFVIKESGATTSLDSTPIRPNTNNQVTYNPLPDKNNLLQIHRTCQGADIQTIDSCTLLEALFSFKSLAEWRVILDSLLYAANGTVLLTEVLHIQAFEAILVRVDKPLQIDPSSPL